MLVAGLTGNYGMGKSSVLFMFRNFGAAVFDSDQIVASLLLKKSVISKIRDLLGDDVMHAGNSLNKKVVANIIFNNSKLRTKLEAILHPLVMRKIQNSIAKIRGKQRIVIVEIPLLFEAGYQSQLERTIVVYSNRKNLLERLKRRGISRKEALLRLKAQMDIREKKKLADFVINNNASPTDTKKQVKKIYEFLDSLSQIS